MKEIKLPAFSGHVAVLQLENLDDTSRIDTYLRSIPPASVILMGEYVANEFFSPKWPNAPPPSLRDEGILDKLKRLAKEHSHAVVAPIVQYKNKSYYKSMALISEEKVHLYNQQRLIQYEHWNESAFFSNGDSKMLKCPLVFSGGDMRFGVMFGFEAHFDELWMELKKAEVDIVLVATASAFALPRWQALLTTHAFTNSCFVVRANRIGSHEPEDGHRWDFHGNSFASLGPDMVDSLGQDEGLLCVEVDKKALDDLRERWKF